MTAFYKNYAALCAKAGKSLSAVAQDLGFSRTSPNGWKKGKFPRDSSLAKIADYFGVSVQQLLSENENKPAPVLGDELDIKEIINNMSREELVDFIMMASARLRDMD